MSLLVKDILYILSKEQKVAGTLSVSSSHIDFEPRDATLCQPISIAVNTVPDSLLRAKGKPLLRIPLRNGGLTFEFEAEADRDQAVDVLTPLLKEAQRKGKGIASVAAGPPSPAGAASGPQAALKLQLLKENRDLQQLYNQLVMRGVLTEEEFWRGRQSLLKHKLQDGAAQKQRRGFDNAMISEVAAGGGSKVTLKLTPELKEQIYGERPHIRRAFAALVPQSVSEKDFWQKYFNYELARKAHGGKPGDDPEDPYKEFLDPEQDGKRARGRLGSVDLSINLAADTFDRAQARSAAAVAQDAQLGSRSAQVIHDINQHAAVIMQGLPQAGDEDADGRLRRSREATKFGGGSLQAMEDLQGPGSASFSELRIRDPQRFFEGNAAAGEGQPQAENGSMDVGTGDAESALRAVEGLCRTGLVMPVVDPDAAGRTLVELPQGFQNWCSPLTGLHAKSGNMLQQLVPQLQTVLRETVLTSNELLRHFWGAFPLSSAAREARAVRLKQALADQYDRTTAMQESSQGSERVYITQLLKPLRQALDAAIIKHDREVELRSAAQ